MFTILVAEDDASLNKMICTKLNREQFKAIPAFDGEEALEVMDREHVDLIISDVMMPKMDGYELTKLLRDSRYYLPVLMITAKDQLEDMEKGFVVGTDDYMIKPINLKEMILRVKALLRRAQLENQKYIKIGNTELDYAGLTVTVDGKTHEMPPKEFYLLFKLLNNPNKVFTRLELLDEIWGVDSNTDERNVDAHIKKLRKKFENVSDFEIITVRGLGYKAVFKPSER
ncbi:MAG: response regulator transcription factor [Lachnoclostridium sp.]|nr:response regulator transcription factor [Lachnoclostridium sp.]